MQFNKSHFTNCSPNRVRKRVFFLICLVFLGLNGPQVGAITSVNTSSKETNNQRRVTFVKGDVEYRAAEDERWTTIEDTNLSLPLDADLKVEDDGALEITPADTGSLKLNEQTGISLSQEGDSTLNLNLAYGSAKINAPAKSDRMDTIKLETPTGIIGVRGTEFGASHEQSNRSEVHVTEGSVSLRANEDQATVSAGRFAAFGSSEDGQGIFQQGPLLDRHQTVWQYWGVRKKLQPLREQKSSLESTLGTLREQLSGDGIGGMFGEMTGAKEQIEQASETLDRVEQKISQIRSDYQSTIQGYREYRRELEEKRGQFLQERKRSFERR